MDVAFLPKGYNLNFLRTSGWYAPSDKLYHTPNNFLLYHLFIVAPNPDIYITQFAFGVLYKLIVPSVTDGDIDLVDGEIIRDKNDNIVFSNKRATIDYDADGQPDEDLGSVYMRIGNELYNIVRYTTDEESTAYLNSDQVHMSSIDNLLILPNNANSLKFSSDTEQQSNYDFLDDADIKTKNGIVKARAIIQDSPETIILDKSAIFVRSYIDSDWTNWKLLSSDAVAPPIQLEDEVTHQIFNLEELYDYIDRKLTFSDSTASNDLFGLKVEITGTYNEAPYDPNRNVYGVEASGIEYDDVDDFPHNGDPEILYISKNENMLYRWDEATESYYIVGSNIYDIGGIAGGDNNQQNTNQQNTP